MTPEGGTYIPYLQTDFIYSAIAQELGLAGAAAVLLLYIVLVYRGFRIAMLADDGFSKLLAAGLTVTLAVQAFIIVGGVTGLIPADRNHASVRLLRRLEPRRQLPRPLAPDGGLEPRQRAGGRRMNAQIRKLFLVLCLLFVAVIATTTYWLWRSPDLEARQGNPTLVVRQLTIKRGLIFASDGRTVLARNRPRKVQGRTWYLRTYPQRRSHRPRRRLLDRRPLAGRPREVDERLPHRIEREPVDRGQPARSTSSAASRRWATTSC